MDLEVQPPSDIDGTPWECQKCYGKGTTHTGGCSLEHGHSTSCEEFGCEPVREIRCPECKGTGVVVMPPSFKKWIGLARYLNVDVRSHQSTGQAIGLSSGLHIRILFDVNARAYVLSARGYPGPDLSSLVLREASPYTLQGEGNIAYLDQQLVAKASVSPHGASGSLDLRIDVVTETGHTIWTCEAGF